MKKKIACVISCYNERENIPAVVNQILDNKLNERIHFVLVDNASSDNSNLLFKENTRNIFYYKYIFRIIFIVRNEKGFI